MQTKRRLFPDIDCENCPLAWEDKGYEGDCDCGCLVYGDLYEGSKPICHLPQFVKTFMAKQRERKNQKKMGQQYNDMLEWYAERDQKINAMTNAIKEALKEHDLTVCFYNEQENTYHPVISINSNAAGDDCCDVTSEAICQIIDSYEDALNENAGKK